MFKYKKELGQNFLIDEKLVKQIVDALEVKNTDFVVEIGPGNGALTTQLLRGNPDIQYRGIEIDNRLIPDLEKILPNPEKQKIINISVLDWLTDENVPAENKILGALPFYITSPIIHKIVHLQNMPQTAVLIVQEEVADKILGVAPDASYLSNFVQTFFHVSEIAFIDKTAFEPSPSVNAKAIKLTASSTTQVLHVDKHRFEKFLHHAFLNPRKMINKSFELQHLETAQIDPTNRPQHVSTESWITLFELLKSQ